jgi:hypothetical protein
MCSSYRHISKYSLFNYLENQKTYRKCVSDITRAFHFYSQVLFKMFFIRIIIQCAELEMPSETHADFKYFPHYFCMILMKFETC